MFDPDIHQSAMAELEWVSTELQSDLHSTTTAPDQLFHRTDAVGLRRLIRTQALHALHSRLGWGGDVTSYGVDLVQSFLKFRAATSEPGASAEFCEALLANFQPRGSHFDCFFARLFEDEAHLDSGSDLVSCYAVGLATGHMALQAQQRHEGATVLLQPAIYPRQQQLDIIGRLYATYESFYARSLHRYGKAAQDTVLVPSWDMFRRDIGEFLPRFRCPSRSHEKEWLAIALTGQDQEADGVFFAIQDNRLAPAVKLDISRLARHGGRTLPLHSLVLGNALPFDITREALQIFLSRSKVPFVKISRAGTPCG